MGNALREHIWNLLAKKLADEASAEELQELQDLLRKNPELHYPTQMIADLWEHSSPVDSAQSEAAFHHHLDRIDRLNIDYAPALSVVPDEPRPSSFIRRKAFLLIATTVVATAAIFLVTTHTDPGPPVPAINQTIATASNEITTHAGSRTSLTLPDNTRVWLNAGSQIRYGKDFMGNGQREVDLTGEAFFDVAPDAAHPFIIHASKVDVRVLGTSFNIKSYPSDKTTEATLIRGSIEISIRNRPSDKIILKPNEKLVVNNDDSLLQRKEVHRKTLHPESLVVISKPTYEQRSGVLIETSWVNNKLIFQDEEFGELAREMERWYGVTIHFEDARMETFRYTGTFEKETIRQALDALKMTDQKARFDYTIDGTSVTIHN